MPDTGKTLPSCSGALLEGEDNHKSDSRGPSRDFTNVTLEVKESTIPDPAPLIIIDDTWDETDVQQWRLQSGSPQRASGQSARRHSRPRWQALPVVAEANVVVLLQHRGEARAKLAGSSTHRDGDESHPRLRREDLLGLIDQEVD